MTSRLARRIAIVAAGAALAGMGSLTACSTTAEKEKEAPATSSTMTTSAPAATTSAPAASPTEKAAGPGGNNSFSPTVNPQPPGAVCKQLVNGVCIR